MFKTAELGRKVSKKDYEALLPGLRADLLRLQQQLRHEDFPVILVLSGDDRIGIAETLSLLHEWMDPRSLQTSAFDRLTTEERERPEYWRFWMSLPPRGTIGIIFGSWYRRAIREGVKTGANTARLGAALARINLFEKELVDDGALILKFWFHVKKGELERRVKRLAHEPRGQQLSLKDEREILRLYDKGGEVIGRVLRETSTGEAPWKVVEGTDARYRNLSVGETIVEELTQRLERPRPPKAKRAMKAVTRVASAEEQTILGSLDLSKTLSRARYNREMDKQRARLARVVQKAIDRQVSSVLVFEGWDAAGKGGIVKRLSRAMDARHYRVIPIAAPTDEEAAHHYLWRFWRHLPRAGRVTIFDRSWYGRVMVERVEGFAREEEWRRAYREINDFEEQLAEHGILVLKFWLHIDKDEQLRRFREREETPYKNYKITPEDWRNRKKWDRYEVAVNEAIARTSTPRAPWILVEANDKLYARVKVIETFAAALEKHVKKRK